MALLFRSEVWTDRNLSKTFSSSQEIYGPVEVGRKEGKKVVCASKISIEGGDGNSRYWHERQWGLQVFFLFVQHSLSLEEKIEIRGKLSSGNSHSVRKSHIILQ